MMCIARGARRKSKPDIFLSHSFKDRKVAADLADDLNFCSTDVWLDQWELQIGQSLTDEIAKAMDASRYIAILITGNYNKSVWTKAEYKKALSREQREGRTVMLPLLLGEAELPDFLEERIYVDLRTDYFSGLTRIAGMVHGLSEFRIARAIADQSPKRVSDIWQLLMSIGFEPYVVVGEDDFEEILKYGGSKIRDDYARFYPPALLESPAVSKHVKALLEELS
jgi:TIR domain